MLRAALVSVNNTTSHLGRPLLQSAKWCADTNLISLPIEDSARNAVFNRAVGWAWLDVNPIRMVRQSAKRTRTPIVLSIEQIAALLRILKEPTRTMVFLAVHGPSGWGVVRPQVEGYRFSEDGSPCHPLDRDATRG
jgi:hypothetical protein